MIVRVVATVLLVLALSGCDRGVGESPQSKQGDQAYLLFRPADAQQGWDAIMAIRAGLPTNDAKRIRTSGIIDAQRLDMYVDVNAACDRDAAFVASVQRIAREKGIMTLTCSNTLPGAL